MTGAYATGPKFETAGGGQMGKDSSDEAVGERGRDSSRPARELGRLRQCEAIRDKERRCRMQRAALAAAGELGYRELTVRHVLERSGEPRARFYRHFANKAACYEGAYEIAANRLGDRLVAIAEAESGWEAGLSRALDCLAQFLVDEPLLARGILVEIHVAGGPAAVKRREVFERLSRAIDSARRETKSRHTPPPIAAEFILAAIEETAVDALIRGAPQEFGQTIPDLSRLAMAIYFGADASRQGPESGRS